MIYFGYPGLTPTFEYHHDPEKTSAGRLGDLVTAGDYGYFDDDGYLFLLDRRTDVIISGGVNIYPAEIEQHLITHPSVDDVAVIGVPDPEWGSSVLAVVQPSPPAVAGEELAAGLLAYCGERLASFKRPRRIEFVSDFPRTESGKVQRRVLRDRFAHAPADLPARSPFPIQQQNPTAEGELAVSGICEGRIAVITGAGRGIGREHALELARQGAAVVVNDLGGGADGTGADATAAQAVADEIAAAGGRAVANTDDVSDTGGARRLIDQAIEAFGGLDVLVNNAGILRDRTIATMSDQEWDDVIRVHLRGTFAPTRFAVAYWRDKAKRTGQPTGARLINTTSASGIYGNFGQSNYGAAKGGIASFTVIVAKELARYGATANAVAPAARTRLTEALMPADYAASLGPEHISPLVAWLASDQSGAITGRVFDVGGGRIGVAESWRLGPEAAKDGAWDAAELGAVIPDLVAKAAPNVDMTGRVPTGATP
jgi:NAD(P)-dependent dehydrogenase (short-subunit alcohol dehydrogenase family)